MVEAFPEETCPAEETRRKAALEIRAEEAYAAYSLSYIAY